MDGFQSIMENVEEIIREFEDETIEITKSEH